MTTKYPGRASISECGLYRYRLERDLPPTLENSGVGAAAFIMLNPSTADASDDDPTIRKITSYTIRWGYERLVVGNLFAYRTPDPGVLIDAHKQGVDVIGDNDDALTDIVRTSELVVCAWGVHGYNQNLPKYRPRTLPILPIAATTRASYVRQLLENSRILYDKPRLHYLKLTKDRYPYHPLYLKGDLLPTEWK